MKTVASILNQIEENHKTIQSLLGQLHQLHIHNTELTDSLVALQINNQQELGEEEEDNSKGIEPGDRVVILSPDRNRRGLTGHIESRSNKIANFRADDNKTTFPVKIYNLFKLKKQSKS